MTRVEIASLSDYIVLLESLLALDSSFLIWYVAFQGCEVQGFNYSRLSNVILRQVVGCLMNIVLRPLTTTATVILEVTDCCKLSYWLSIVVKVWISRSIQTIEHRYSI